MLKLFKNKSIIILFLICFSSLSFSANKEGVSINELNSKSQELENIITDQLEITSIEELQKDLSNRLILGVFGKDALIFSLGSNVSDEVINQISSMSMSDVQEYSKPFNIGNLNGLLMILSSFFFVSFSVLTIYFIWVMFESLVNTQDSGQFFGDKTSTLFSVLKGGVASILIIPAYGFSHKPFSDFENSIDGSKYGSFSLAQVFVFKVVGLSNNYSNHIWGSFVNNYQKAFPVLTLPNTYSKENDMKNLLDYVMCVKSYNNQDISNISFKRESNSSGSYSFDTSFRQCVLSGNIKYNLSMIQELKKDNEHAKLVNSVVDYEKLFTETVKNSMSEIINKSIIYADILLKEASNLTTSNERSGALVNASNWRGMCDEPEKMFETGKINNQGLPLIQYYMEKCLSENFILSFLSKDKEKAKSYYETNVLTGYKTDLCDVPTAAENGMRTFVKTSDIGTSLESASKTLKECLNENCNSAESGLYQCTSAIEFSKVNNENERMIKQGWLTAGAYSYALFSGFTNNIAKEIVSSLGTDFAFTGSSNVSKENQGDFKFGIKSINSSDTNTSKEFEDLLKLTTESNRILEAKKETANVILPPNGIFGKNSGDGLFGIHKFVNCSSSPMSIINGYSCGNITEEMHDLGSKMITMAIELKIASTASQLFGFTKNRSKVQQNTGSASATKAASFFGLPPNIYQAVLRVIGVGTATSLAGSTAFSDIDSYWIQNPETYLTVVALFAGEVPFLNGLIDFAFGILFLLGLIFGFILPLLPYFLWITVIGGWAIMVLQSLLIVNVWAATLISPSHDHTSKTAKKGLLILLTIVLRSPFMVVGLVLAWLLSNILIGSLLEIANIDDALLLTTSISIAGFIDMFVKLIVYLSLVYFIYNLVFSIIEGFYEIGSNWLFGSALSPFSSKDRSEKWRGSISGAKSFIGVKK